MASDGLRTKTNFEGYEMSEVIEGTAEEVEDEFQLLQISDLDQFAKIITGWHQLQVATIRHLYEMPEGIEVQEEDGEPFKLEGDTKRAFQLGLQMAMEYLGKLPFKPEYEEPETAH